MDGATIALFQGDPGEGGDKLDPKNLGQSIRKTVAQRTLAVVQAHCPALAIGETLLRDYLSEEVCGAGCEVPEDFLSRALSDSGLPRHLWERVLEQFAVASGLRFPFLGFADRMAVPIEFYTQEGDIAELCRLLRVPVLQAESGCFLTLASINPFTVDALASEIPRIFRRRGLIVPVVFAVRTDFEGWHCLCQRHFAA